MKRFKIGDRVLHHSTHPDYPDEAGYVACLYHDPKTGQFISYGLKFPHAPVLSLYGDNLTLIKNPCDILKKMLCSK